MSSAHYSVAAAILEINNNAVFVCYGDNPNSIEWLDGTTPISVSDIVSKQAELKTAYDALEYQRKRKAEYPSIQDQLEVSHILDDSELELLFWKLSKADRHHSVEVMYRTMKKTSDKEILKLALLHDIGKCISEYSWIFRIMTELGLIKSFKSNLYLNHENIGYDLLKSQDFKTDVSKLYFDKLLNNKNEIMESTDY